MSNSGNIDARGEEAEAPAATTCISGMVKDDANKPVAGVNVKLAPAKALEAVTDPSGRFEFPGLPPDSYSLTCLVDHSHIKEIEVKPDVGQRRDPALATEKAPNQWNALNDYSKTVITLASAFLAVTVTFSGQLMGKETNLASNRFLMGTWGLLVGAIACGVLTAAFVINYLRHNKSEKPAILFANLSYVLLFLAGASFLIVGSRAINSRKPWDARKVIETTLTKMPEVSKTDRSAKWAWRLQSLEVDGSSQVYKLVVTEEATSRKFQVWVDPIKQELIRVEPVVSVSSTASPSPIASPRTRK
jgi:hypothetical protein